MYLAIDVGGSKTLVAVFSLSGEMVFSQKIETSHDYYRLIEDLKQVLQQNQFEQYDFTAVCCALPGTIDRAHGIGLDFGNLPWHNVPIKTDLEKILPGADIFVEHDDNLAGLYEATLVHGRYKKVLYLTISTGIGDGIIINGKIDPTFADSESGQMMIEHSGELKRWEDIASGRAFVEMFGKRASEVNDPSIWQKFVRNLAPGIGELTATIQPDVIILGGSVGAQLGKFKGLLKTELERYENKLVDIPPIIKAHKAEEAVVYGCYEFIRQNISGKDS